MKTELYTYDDLEAKGPFRELMRELCAWGCTYERKTCAGWLFPVQVNVYHITYDEQQMRDNWSEIVKRVKKKQCYLRADPELKGMIDKLRESIDAYDGDIPAFYQDRNFLIEGCHSKEGSYDYDIKNQHVSLVSDYSKLIKTKLRPLAYFAEHNGWEREVWRFYFDYPTDPEDINVLNSLKSRLAAMKPIDQVIGKTTFRVVLDPIEYEEVDFYGSKASYLRSRSFIGSHLNRDAIMVLISLDDQGIFNALYKGGFCTLCKA